MSEIGIITEQGDLGFGFDKLNEKDTKVYNEATKNKYSDKTNVHVFNENNKDK